MIPLTLFERFLGMFRRHPWPVDPMPCAGCKKTFLSTQEIGGYCFVECESCGLAIYEATKRKALKLWNALSMRAAQPNFQFGVPVFKEEP